ncbi:MAG: DUF1501 domain-containing protein [Verrucomicrobiaceae bacterium]|nr:DUF1501 domain-containing protein [Verrucomicrobiaceae bacterium]
MKTLLQAADPFSRREFAMSVAKTCLGVSVLGRGLNAVGAPFDDASKAKQVPTARNVIYLYMSGGMTHLDTFGCVPGADTMGETKTIPTSADGVQIGHMLPKTARTMHRATVFNGISSTQGAHAQGNYFMHTGYSPRGATRHPTMGAWLQKFQGKGNPALPGSVLISGDSRHPGAGFFEADFQPLAINNAATGLANSKMLPGLAEDDFNYRVNLSSRLDAAFRSTYNQSTVRAYADVYSQAIKVMKSEDLVAFDLSKESQSAHDAYGSNDFGQGCLLARRLIEHGVRFVEVTLGGWDMHQDIYSRLPEKLGILDNTLGALIADLESRGLLNDTMVVLTTEFGRTPNINQNAGRDHYPKAFSSVIWGGGIKGGYVHGKTDKGIAVTEQGIGVPDLSATIGYALGLPLDQVLFSPNRRPFTVADKGKPVLEAFA